MIDLTLLIYLYNLYLGNYYNEELNFNNNVKYKYNYIKILYKYNIINNLIMNSDIINKNKPNLTDHVYLQNIINKKIQPINIIKPTIISKIIDKLKINFSNFIENNLFLIFIIIIIICLLIYRYFQYQIIKNKINNELLQSYDNKIEYNKNEYNKNEYNKNEYNKDEYNKNEYNNNEYNKIESNKIESNNIESNKIESNKIESNKIESNKIKSNKIETNQLGRKKKKVKININSELEQHNNNIPDLLFNTNDRSFNIPTNDLTVINSSSYAPHNLRNLNTLHTFNNNQNYNLI